MKVTVLWEMNGSYNGWRNCWSYQAGFVVLCKYRQSSRMVCWDAEATILQTWGCQYIHLYFYYLKGCHASFLHMGGATGWSSATTDVRRAEVWYLLYKYCIYIGEGTGSITNGDWLYCVMLILASLRRFLHWNGCRTQCDRQHLVFQFQFQMGWGWVGGWGWLVFAKIKDWHRQSLWSFTSR